MLPAARHTYVTDNKATQLQSVKLSENSGLWEYYKTTQYKTTKIRSQHITKNLTENLIIQGLKTKIACMKMPCKFGV